MALVPTPLEFLQGSRPRHLNLSGNHHASGRNKMLHALDRLTVTERPRRQTHSDERLLTVSKMRTESRLSLRMAPEARKEGIYIGQRREPVTCLKLPTAMIPTARTNSHKTVAPSTLRADEPRNLRNCTISDAARNKGTSQELIPLVLLQHAYQLTNPSADTNRVYCLTGSPARIVRHQDGAGAGQRTKTRCSYNISRNTDVRGRTSIRSTIRTRRDRGGKYSKDEVRCSSRIARET